jgi:hypothetical protein
MTWFWLNIPLAAVLFLAMSGIPLWLVIKHPDTGPDIPTPDRCPSWPSTPGQRAGHAAGQPQPSASHADSDAPATATAGRAKTRLPGPRAAGHRVGDTVDDDHSVASTAA